MAGSVLQLVCQRGKARGRRVVSAGADDRAAGRGTMATELVIEDEPIVRDVIAAALEDQGYRVVAAADGVALAAATAVRVDLILLDVRMTGLDGDEVLARLRADPATRPIPLVVLAAAWEL